MIDKTTTEWKSAPFWVRFGLLGIRTRRVALAFELTCALFALVCLILSYFSFHLFLGTLLFAAAYWYAVCIRWVDNAGQW